MMLRGTFVLSSSRAGPQVGCSQSTDWMLSNSRPEALSVYVRLTCWEKVSVVLWGF